MPARRNFFFPLTALASALFIVTVLLLIATVFGDPRAPANQFFDRNAGVIMAAEVAAILLFGFLALVVDRRQTAGREERPETLRVTNSSDGD